MADMMDTLKTLLGDNADGKIQNAMNALKGSGLIDTGTDSKKNTLEKVAEGINNDIKKDTGGTGGLSPEGIEFLNQINKLRTQR